jgi:hypothetical protein
MYDMTASAMSASIRALITARTDRIAAARCGRDGCDQCAGVVRTGAHDRNACGDGHVGAHPDSAFTLPFSDDELLGGAVQRWRLPHDSSASSPPQLGRRAGTRWNSAALGVQAAGASI